MTPRHDQIWVGQLAGPRIAVAYGVTPGVVNEAVRRHDCDPVSAHILGRALTTGLLGAATMPDGTRLNIRWAYEGLLRTVVVDAGADGTARGFISPAHLAGRSEDEDVLYGDTCVLRVVRSDASAVLNSGTADTVLQDVVNDFAYYCAVSEQVESGLAAWIGFSANVEQPVTVCRGVLLQAMPETDLEAFDRVRARLGSDEVRELLAHPREEEDLVSRVMKAVLTGMVNAGELVMIERSEPVFACTCSEEKMTPVVRSLPEEDRESILAKGEPVRVQCQFCNRGFTVELETCRAVWSEG